MIYSSLIYLLVVIAILATGPAPEATTVRWWEALLTFVVKILVLAQTARFVRKRRSPRRPADYFSMETGLSILALALFGLDVYLLDLKYYLGMLPLVDQIPAIADLVGIAVYLGYLVVIWLQLKEAYDEVFGVGQARLVYLASRLRLSVALVLPWLIFNFAADVLFVLPVGRVRELMDTGWGEPVVLLLAILTAVAWFPPLLVRMLGCTPMPAGPDREAIEALCAANKATFRDVLLWPLFEGRVLTAGVVGLIGRFRYLLVTPALLDALEPEELEAVVAHEIGHVRRYHLPLYLLLFLGFGAILQLGFQPFLYMLLQTRVFYEVLFGFQGDAASLVAVLVGGPVILVTLFYFRYVFGFFMRNFERQADQYAMRSTGDPRPLINVFRKIALLSGGGDRPCWHHFSINQRIEHLARCREQPGLADRHDLKVYGSLAGYFLVVFFGFMALQAAGSILLRSSPGAQIAEGVITEKISRDPDNPLWHQFHGDLLIARKQYDEAIAAFERSLGLDPDNPETLNNMAWLLLTVEKKSLLDPARALELAERAAALQAKSHILDTLAEAYWQNGMTSLAIDTEIEAIDKARGDKSYYRRQLEKFRSDNS